MPRFQIFWATAATRLEFAPLLFFGQRIAAPRQSKAALRAERKLLHRDIPRSLLDLPG
jgi:hypothetical protein